MPKRGEKRKTFSSFLYRKHIKIKIYIKIFISGPDGTAASGHVKPPPFPNGDKDRPIKKPSGSLDLGSSDEILDGNSGYGRPGSVNYRPGSGTSNSGAHGSPESGSQGTYGQGSGSYKPDSHTSVENGENFGGDESVSGYDEETGIKPTKPSGE